MSVRIKGCKGRMGDCEGGGNWGEEVRVRVVMGGGVLGIDFVLVEEGYWDVVGGVWDRRICK